MADNKEVVAIGYLSVQQDDRLGWTGGLLVLNNGGRPLEFQCTLPIRPTRAHEILFAATLRQHLIGEVIGPTLMSKCRTPLSILCCEQVEALKLQDNADATSSSCPVVLVTSAAEPDEGPIDADMITGHDEVRFGSTTLLVAIERSEEVAQIVRQLGEFPDAVEPFERIREAIREAQSQIARAA